MKIKLIGIVVIVAGAAFLAACGPSDTACNSADISYGDDGTPDLGGCQLRVAVENAYIPFNFVDTDTGEGQGYDYDFFNEFCERANCNTEFVVTTWMAMVAVMAGEQDIDTYDVGANGITIKPERAENVDFSAPYVSLTEVLLVRLDEDRFSTPEEFAANSDLLIATQLGTTNADTAVDLIGEDRVTQTEQFGEAVQLLISSDVDAVVIDNVSGRGYTGANADQLMVLDVALTGENALGFIFSQGSNLVEAIDWAIAEFEEDGTLERLDEWFQTS